MRLPRQSGVLLAAFLLLTVIIPAQTLAHKNWQGNGLTVDPWWKNAVFYQLNPLTFQQSTGSGDLNGITARLDYLQTLGVDAILLSPFQLAATAQSPWNPAYGSAEDFDHLQQEASQHKIRLLVDLPQSRLVSAEQSLSQARFWLSRGVSGFRLTSDASAAEALDSSERVKRIRLLRHLLASFSGDRVLMDDPSPTPAMAAQATPAHHRRTADPAPTASALPQLWVDQTLAQTKLWDSNTLSSTLFQSRAPGAVLITDRPGEFRSLTRSSNTPEGAVPYAKIIAAALFLGRELPMLSSGQEIGTPSDSTGDSNPDSLLSWYRRLSQIRHAEAALHGGSIVRIDTGYPEVLAWVRMGEHPADQPILVVCNQSSRALVISVAESLKRFGLSTIGGINTLASSTAGAEVSNGQGIDLSQWGVYVGELREPGLEAARVPVARTGLHRQ